MRTLRVSLLMRRASPVTNTGRVDGSGDALKGLARRSSTYYTDNENRGENVAGLPALKEPATPPSQKKKSRTRLGTAVESQPPISVVSTPTRDSIKAREGRNINPCSSITDDADRAQAQLQQMWDDGELSPRAPLDRSLGYFSSASPVSSGKGVFPAATGANGGAGNAQVYRQHKAQQGMGGPLFISDLRALRQMVPFSSTEEQVLTRSQRRRSSANLLQQLVASQPQGSIKAYLQEHAPASQEKHTGVLARLQHFQGEEVGGRRQQQREQKEGGPVLSCSDTLFGLNAFPAATVAPQGLGIRKRRASSPVVSHCSLLLHVADAPSQDESNITSEGLSRSRCRRRLSLAVAASQKAVTTGALLGFPRSSPRRNFAGAVEVACSNSSKIESPFQKLPPPSPSDFPVASPLPKPSPLRTTCCSPRRPTAAEEQQKQGRVEDAALKRPSGCAPATKQKEQHLGSPLRTSPRRSHGVGKASYLLFQTPRSLCCPNELSDGTADASNPQRDPRQRLSPLPFALGCPRGRRATQRPRCGMGLSKDARGPVLLLPEAKASAAAAATAEMQTLTPKVSTTPRLASVATSKSNGTSNKHGPAKNEASVGGQTLEHQGVGRRTTSPIRPGPLVPRWQTSGRSDAAAAEQHCREQLLPSASPTATTKLAVENRAESTDMAPSAHSGDPETSASAASEVVATGRRRSLVRRTSRLPITGGLSATLDSSLLPPIITAFSPVAPQDTASAAVASTTRASSGVAAVAGSPNRRLATKIGGPSTRAAASRAPPKSGALAACGNPSVKSTAAAAPAAAHGRLALAPTARPSVGKPRSSSNTIQQRNKRFSVASDRVRVLPIAKQRAFVSFADKKRRGSNTITAKGRPTAADEATQGPRRPRSRAALARSCTTSTVSAAGAPGRQRRPLLQCGSKRPAKSSMEPSKATADIHTDSPGASTAATAAKANSGAAERDTDTVLHPSSLLGHVEPPSVSTVNHKLPLVLTDGAIKCTVENTSCMSSISSSSSCSVSSAIPSSVNCVTSASETSSSPVDMEGTKAAAQQEWRRSKSPPPSRRRSSSPHQLSLHKSTRDLVEEEKHQVGDSSTSMRRASSGCVINYDLRDCVQQRVSVQQQQHEAQHQEWEGRDREYQEKQQLLLLEQQRKERLLAWEQREAELLKNRKALSKEEPSFWGFDPFMVDEEDERVLTTEELRVEVSRFLKGDLRFHSRADLLRVVKKFSEQTRTTTTTTSSRLNFTKVEQRVVPMAARQVHGTVPHERRRKSILRSSNSTQSSECRRRSRGISFSPFNKVQLYMLDEHERASKEAAANLSQQGEQRQQLRQKLAQQFQLVLLRGDSDFDLTLLRRELADLYDPDDDESLAFLSPTLAPGREGDPENKGTSTSLSHQEEAERLKGTSGDATASLVSHGNGEGCRLPFTVSPSWRQRQHGMWQETPGELQTEQGAEWSTPSPFEHGRFNCSEGNESSGCWETPVTTTEGARERERTEVCFGNDENANCNEACMRMPLLLKDAVQESKRHLNELSTEEPPKLHGVETARRPSVLSRRLSVVPNVHSL